MNNEAGAAYHMHLGHQYDHLIQSNTIENQLNFLIHTSYMIKRDQQERSQNVKLQNVSTFDMFKRTFIHHYQFLPS